ncbi:MAG: DUF1772 domain-containing protein [Actinomycetota bacterium]|nr:DUF1772 domain-containing protein [Actinomycetota bacterium]
MNGFVVAAVFAVALGSALVAGVFFAFSSFVMAGLGQLPPARGIAAMQSINRTALRPPFMLALFGTALACLGLAGWAVANWGQQSTGWVLGGAALYVIGAVVVTIARSVPRNEALARLDPDDSDAPERWRRYVTTWTAWNSVRSLASLGAAGLLTVGLMQS